MPQQKPIKPAEVNPWGWVNQVNHEMVKKAHVLLAYRITGFVPCSEARRNCKRNPYCIWGLGEKKWRDENEGDDDDEGAAFRCEGEYAGLQNLGATCYVNSLLQLWFHNPIFRPAILKWTPATKGVNQLAEYKPSCPLAQLQAIFARLKISKRSKIDPSDFVSSLLLNTGEQQDAQEFAKLFMDFIVNLLTEYGDDQIQKLIDQSFNGQLQYETECQGCKNRTRRSESFTELNLSVKKNLSESLDDLLADEIISDEYMCSHCHQKNTAKRRMQLTKLPPIMNLQLLRFVYDREANRRKKVTQSISFPEILEMNQKIHRPTNHNASSSEHKYHLTAVLIHNGQSASSGHYVAQIKDLRNGEWLKFNDEFVDPVNRGKTQKVKDDEADELEKKNKPKKSKNSPSLSSSGAYMLVYTLDKYIQNPEPDPDLHQYLVNLVRREDTSFELEVNKNKSEKDFELAVKNQRRKEVDWLYQFQKKGAVSNGAENAENNLPSEGPKAKIPRYDIDLEASDSELMDVDSSPNCADPCDSTKNGHSDKNKQNGLSSEVSALPVRKDNYDTQEMDFVSIDWIAQWLDPVNPVPPIENGMLLCEHKKLAPPSPSSTPCLYRIVPTPLANVWYENYQGGPRLKSEDLCETCVQMQCKKLRALAQLDDDSKQLSELVKKCDSECAPYLKVGQDIPNSVLATKVWISKESLRNWKKIAKRAIDGPSQVALDKADQNKENEVQQVSSEEGNGDIGSFNADLFCEHGNMSPDPSTRRLIPKEAWAIIEKYFSNSVMLVATDSMSCDDCRNLEQQNTIEVQRSKEIAAKQRSALGDLYCNRNRPDIDKVGELYIVSTNFVQEWKRFIKDPSRHRPVVNINNRTLICEHEKFMYPMMFVSEFLKCNEEADEMVLLITPEEWLFMEENFECDQEIKVNVLNLDKKDNLEYRPDICNTCAESWLEGAFRRQFQYQDAPIYVIRREKGETFESEDEDAPKTTNIVSGKREVKPVNPDAWMQGFAGSNSVRRSQRPRNAKGEKTYKVSATTTIKELKSKICTDFKTLLSDQHLYYGSNELDNLSKKLQDYDIPAGAKLYLEIDTAENGSMDEPMSTVETGFQGTLLQGGSAFGDTRSPSS